MTESLSFSTSLVLIYPSVKWGWLHLSPPCLMGFVKFCTETGPCWLLWGGPCQLRTRWTSMGIHLTSSCQVKRRLEQKRLKQKKKTGSQHICLLFPGTPASALCGCSHPTLLLRPANGSCGHTSQRNLSACRWSHHLCWHLGRAQWAVCARVSLASTPPADHELETVGGRQVCLPILLTSPAPGWAGDYIRGRVKHRAPWSSGPASCPHSGTGIWREQCLTPEDCKRLISLGFLVVSSLPEPRPGWLRCAATSCVPDDHFWLLKEEARLPAIQQSHTRVLEGVHAKWNLKIHSFGYKKNEIHVYLGAPKVMENVCVREEF